MILDKKLVKSRQRKILKSNIRLCIEAGKHANYLAQMKNTSVEKYNFVKKIGIEKYISNSMNMKIKMGEIYWEIKEDKKLTFTELYKYIKEPIYGSVESFMMSISNLAFNTTTHTIPLKTYQKMETLILEYEKWRKDEPGNNTGNN